jgi:hypothetical protein
MAQTGMRWESPGISQQQDQRRRALLLVLGSMSARHV